MQNFITNALAPAKLKTFEIDEANKRVRIIVSEDQLSLAIGKRGQNARLTSKLTGWQVDIEPEVVVTKGFEEKVAEAVESLAAIPGITREQADVLVHHGLTRLEDLLQADEERSGGIPEHWRSSRCDSGSRARRGRAAHDSMVGDDAGLRLICVAAPSHWRSGLSHEGCVAQRPK